MKRAVSSVSLICLALAAMAARTVPVPGATLPEGVSVFVSETVGFLYNVQNDPLTGWTLLVPLLPAADAAYASVERSPGGNFYVTNPAAGTIHQLAQDSLTATLVYDSYANPVLECNAEECDPYAGWVNPVDVTFNTDGDLFFVTAGKQCVLTGLASQGVFRIRHDAPEAAPEPVLGAAAFPGVPAEAPIESLPAIHVVEEGDLTGEMLIVGAASVDGAVPISLSSDLATLRPFPGDVPVDRSDRVRILKGGHLSLLIRAEASLLEFDPTGALVRTTPHPELAEAIDATRDGAGNLYIVLLDGSRHFLTAYDPAGEERFRLFLPFQPAHLFVLDDED